MLDAIINALKSVINWALDFLVDLFISALQYFYPSSSLDWSSVNGAFSVANTFFPVSEFFVLLTAYYAVKGSVWAVKLAIQLL